MEPLDPATTALILIDLQGGIVGMTLAPRSGPEVVDTAKMMAAKFRSAGAPVVLVNVGWRSDGADRPSQNSDEPAPMPPGGYPETFSAFVEGLREPGDVVVLKHHWGAFTGTDLDLQLRRRGIRTVVLAGIATNFGVESTARSAWELSYDIVIAEDATASRSAELHDFAIAHILPKIARIRQSGEIVLNG